MLFLTRYQAGSRGAWGGWGGPGIWGRAGPDLSQRAGCRVQLEQCRVQDVRQNVTATTQWSRWFSAECLYPSQFCWGFLSRGTNFNVVWPRTSGIRISACKVFGSFEGWTAVCLAT